MTGTDSTKKPSTQSPVEEARAAAPLLTQEQLSELLALVHTADTVELKATVPDTDRRSVIAAFDMGPHQPFVVWCQQELGKGDAVCEVLGCNAYSVLEFDA